MNTKQHNKLVEILNNFYWEGSGGHVMCFTEGESEILTEYLLNNGICIRNNVIEEYRKLLDDNTEWHLDSLGISSRYVCIEDINYFARMLRENNK